MSPQNLCNSFFSGNHGTKLVLSHLHLKPLFLPAEMNMILLFIWFEKSFIKGRLSSDPFSISGLFTFPKLNDFPVLWILKLLAQLSVQKCHKRRGTERHPLCKISCNSARCRVGLCTHHVLKGKKKGPFFGRFKLSPPLTRFLIRCSLPVLSLLLRFAKLLFCYSATNILSFVHTDWVTSLDVGYDNGLSFCKPYMQDDQVWTLSSSVASVCVDTRGLQLFNSCEIWMESREKPSSSELVDIP